MVECPNCAKPTAFQRHCSHCGIILQHTAEEKFELLGEAVEKAIKKERQKRKKKKRIKMLIGIAIILLAVYVGIKSVGA
ncbi:zinc ribbon domain-containing protein [Paenibacillus elgii]